MDTSQEVGERVAASAAAPTFRLSRYQWLTLISAFLGWMFDSMDLNLFTLVLVPSVSQLMHTTDAAQISKIGSYIIAGKLLTWGIGGVLFGVAADRLGRSRVMAWTILIYATFTLLSAFAQTWTQLAAAQAMAGFGIGGEWAAGAALVAESWPERYRARAMQIMQMAFAFGFLAAALDNLLLGSLGWRWVLGMGAAPALVTILIRFSCRSRSAGSRCGRAWTPSRPCGPSPRSSRRVCAARRSWACSSRRRQCWAAGADSRFFRAGFISCRRRRRVSATSARR